MPDLQGASCSELPPFVVDKYFECSVRYEPLRAAVAKAICNNCVVLSECRDWALNRPSPTRHGVIAGESASQIMIARSWRRFEIGLRETPPSGTRPDWLALPDAGLIVESMRLADDPDESIAQP